MRIDNFALKHDLDYAMPTYVKTKRGTMFYKSLNDLIYDGYMFHELPMVKFMNLRVYAHGKCYFFEVE